MKNKSIIIGAAALLGINLAVSTAINLQSPFALAQKPTPAVVELKPGILSIIYSPSDFVMTPVNISSPVETYNSYYLNPRSADPDGNPATRDGSALRVQDGRFKGGFELQAQVDSDYISATGTIPRTNLGVSTGIGGVSEINETITQDTTSTTAPLDSEEEYTPFTQPLVLLDASTSTCDEGRVGIYTVYPSFRLSIPNETPAGTYTTSVTYTLLEQPSC